MGSEIYAYFRVEAPARPQSDELAELAAGLRTGRRAERSGEEAQVVARLAPESEVKEGSKARLALDATKLHLFDPSDGTNIAQRGVERPPAAPAHGTRAPRLPSRRTAWNPPVARDPTPSRRDRQIVGPTALTLREVHE